MRKIPSGLGLALLIAGCGSPAAPAVEPAAPEKIVMAVSIKPPAQPTTPPAPPAPSPAETLFGEGIRSVSILTATVLRKEPDASSDKVGVIRKGARAGVLRAVEGGKAKGCARGRWIELAPRGWACESALSPSREEPTKSETVSLADDADAEAFPVEGPYGIVRGKAVSVYETAEDARKGENGRELVGSHTVRSTAIVKVAGKKFWRTSQGDLIDTSSIAVLGPSEFKGVAVGKGGALPAWVHGKADPKKPVTMRAEPSAKAEATGTIAPRTIVEIYEESEDGRFVRIDDRSWVARADVRVATAATPPAGTAAGERWFDVDLDEQVLVAYEGERAVYATLVSTGRLEHATPTRMARVVSKLQTTHMISTQREKYNVSDVPWTMFYDGNYAVHTSYWHDGFGNTRSHGCINLSPRDARLLYQWSSPDVPPGWTAVYGDADHPGSLVRVRSRAVPEPELHGYARTVAERRAAAAAAATAVAAAERPITSPTTVAAK